VGFPDEVPLSASQAHGVVPQTLLEAERDARVMAAFKGQENFKLVTPGDFVISLRSFQGGIEHSAYRGIISPAYTVVSPSADVHPPFFRFCLKEFGYVGRLNAVITGIRDGKTIKYEEFGELDLPVPKMRTQRAIANFLDRKTAAIDGLIEKKQRLLALLDEKRAALINQAVTKGLDPDVPMKDSGVPWIGEIPAHWCTMEMRRAWSVRDCKHRTPDYVDSGYPVVSTTEVKPGRLDLSTACRHVNGNDFLEMTSGDRLPARGDLIYSRNASLGAAAFVETSEPFTMGQDVVLIRSVDQNQLFLSYFLNHLPGRTQVELACIGSTFKRINVGQIRELVITVPPGREQDTIAVALDTICLDLKSTSRRIERQMLLLHEYRQALITAAVTGQIDIPEEAA